MQLWVSLTHFYNTEEINKAKWAKNMLGGSMTTFFCNHISLAAVSCPLELIYYSK